MEQAAMRKVIYEKANAVTRNVVPDVCQTYEVGCTVKHGYKCGHLRSKCGAEYIHGCLVDSV